MEKSVIQFFLNPRIFHIFLLLCVEGQREISLNYWFDLFFFACGSFFFLSVDVFLIKFLFYSFVSFLLVPLSHFFFLSHFSYFSFFCTHNIIRNYCFHIIIIIFLFKIKNVSLKWVYFDDYKKWLIKQ